MLEGLSFKIKNITLKDRLLICGENRSIIFSRKFSVSFVKSEV